MQHKLTQKIAAKYQGGKIKVRYNEANTIDAVMTGVGIETVYFSSQYGDGYMYIDRCQLDLTPLPGITPEHYIEIAKISNIAAGNPDDYLESVGRGIVEYHFMGAIWSDELKNQTETAICSLRGMQILPIIDFLREKNYNVDMLPIVVVAEPSELDALPPHNESAGR